VLFHRFVFAITGARVTDALDLLVAIDAVAVQQFAASAVMRISAVGGRGGGPSG